MNARKTVVLLAFMSLAGVALATEQTHTKMAITSLLQAAGHGSEVRFVDASAPHGGMHGIKVIEKKIEITQ